MSWTLGCGPPSIPGTWNIETTTGKVDDVFDGAANAPPSTTTREVEARDAGTIEFVDGGSGTLTLTKLWTGISSADFAALEPGQEQTGPVEWDYNDFDGAVLFIITAVAVDDMNREWNVTGSGMGTLDLQYEQIDDFSPTQRAVTTRTMRLVRTGD